MQLEIAILNRYNKTFVDPTKRSDNPAFYNRIEKYMNYFPKKVDHSDLHYCFKVKIRNESVLIKATVLIFMYGTHTAGGNEGFKF